MLLSLTTFAAKKKKSASKADVTALQNSFAGLEVEDAEEAEEFYNVTSTAASKPQKASNKADTEVDIYELLISYQIEMAFDVFCFFEDLHKIQDFLKNTWTRYKASELDLITATVVTNSAIDMVHRAEAVLLSTFPEHIRQSESYVGLASIIYFAEALNTGDQGNNKDFWRLKPFDHFVYLTTARTLMKFATLAKAKAAYPMPFMPMKFGYLAYPELRKLPEIQKAETDEAFLAKMMMDLRFRTFFSHGMKGHYNKFPAAKDDLFIEAHQVFWEDPKVHLWIVWTSQIMLDIKDILGDKIHRPYQEMVAYGQKAKMIVDLRHVPGSNHAEPGGNGERWAGKDGDIVLQIHEHYESNILRLDMFVLLREKWMKEKAIKPAFQMMDKLPPEMKGEVEKMMRAKYGDNYSMEMPADMRANMNSMGGMEPIPPAEDPMFIFKYNPLYCGTMMFQLAIQMETAGLTLASHHHTILSVAHLYNGLHQLKLLEQKWPELDRVIDIQMPILFGSALPKDANEVRTRMMTRMGLSSSHFAHADRSRTCGCVPKWSKKNERGPQLTSEPTVQLFRELYSGKDRMEQTLYKLEALMVKTPSNAVSKRQQTIPRRLEPLDFLVQLEAWMPPVTSILQEVDYITLTRECNKLLKLIRILINRACDNPYPITPKLPIEDSTEPIQIYMALAALSEPLQEQMVKDAMKIRDKNVRLDMWPQLDVARDVLGKYIKRKNDLAEKQKAIPS